MKRKILSCYAAVIIAASILALSAAGPKIRDMLSPAVDCVIPELSNTETGVAYKLPKEFLFADETGDYVLIAAVNEDCPEFCYRAVRKDAAVLYEDELYVYVSSFGVSPESRIIRATEKGGTIENGRRIILK